MIILGISEGPDASAALVVEGLLVAAVAQERIDRVRHSAAFPSGAIDAVLDCAGIRARDVDRVVIGGAPPALDATGATASNTEPAPPTRPPPPGSLAALTRGLLDRASKSPRARTAVAATMRATGLHMVSLDATRKRAEARLRGMGFETAEIDVVEEDRCQAWAAYRTQEADAVLVLVLDAAVDGAAVSVSEARHGQIDRLLLQTSFAPLSGLPSRLALRLGVDEEEVLAIAQSAAPDERLVAELDALVGFDAGMLRTRAPRRGQDPVDALGKGVAPAVYAASVLAVVERAVEALARHWLTRTRLQRVAFAGTLFANPHLVGHLAATLPVERLWVAPSPGAGAAAIGAALGTAGTAPREWTTLRCGPTATDDQCYRALSVAELPRNPMDDVARECAAVLAEGRLLARFEGGLAVGPHPLGGRSVLMRPDRSLRARALQALGQPAERPCALLLREEDAARYVPGALRPDGGVARTMAMTTPASAELVAVCPDVLHADGTVHPYLVRASADPALHALLTAVAEATGRGLLAEVPLARAGQPLPASPGDTIRAWRESGVEALALGKYLVVRGAGT